MPSRGAEGVARASSVGVNGLKIEEGTVVVVVATAIDNGSAVLSTGRTSGGVWREAGRGQGTGGRKAVVGPRHRHNGSPRAWTSFEDA